MTLKERIGYILEEIFDGLIEGIAVGLFVMIFVTIARMNIDICKHKEYIAIEQQRLDEEYEQHRRELEGL